MKNRKIHEEHYAKQRKTIPESCVEHSTEVLQGQCECGSGLGQVIDTENSTGFTSLVSVLFTRLNTAQLFTCVSKVLTKILTMIFP